MKVYATYELAPFTPGGVGTYFAHLLEYAATEATAIGMLIGLPIATVDRIRTNFEEKLGSNSSKISFFSVFELASEVPNSNVYWSRSLLFRDAVLKLHDLYHVTEVEFFDYCGPAYHTLLAKCTERALTNLPITIRIHNTLGIIHRAAAQLRPPGPDCPYELERRALLLADRVVTPGALFWSKCAAPLYQVPTERLHVSPPPLAEALVPRPHRAREGIVFVGRPSAIKGFDTFLAALDLLVREGGADRLPPVTLIGPVETVAGGLDLDAMLASRPWAAERVRALGHVHPGQLRLILGGFDIAVFPNRTESFCYALHEARLAGSRIVANTIPAFVEHLPASERHRFFDGTPEGLASELRHLIGTTDTATPADEGRLRAEAFQRGREIVSAPAYVSPMALAQAVLVVSAQVSASAAATYRLLADLRPGWTVLSVAEVGTVPRNGQAYFGLSVFGDAPDRQALALALRFLELNSCLDCVMLLADQSEEALVFADQGVPAAAARLVGVLWQLRGPGAVFDHVAKGIDRLDRADAVTRAFRAVAVGAQEETIAAPSAAWDIRSGRRGPMTLADAATRIEVEAAATPEALFALLARGEAIFLPLGEDVGTDAGLDPIFGLESHGRGYAGRLGALRIGPDVRGIRVAAQGEDAEIWLYRGAERSPLLVTGGTTATIEQLKSPMAPGIHEAGSLETSGLDWTELSVWLVVGLPRESAAATLHMLGEAAPDAVVAVDDCDAVIRLLSQCPPRQVVLLCTVARLYEGDARRLETALAAHSDARALIALEPGLMFSQAWATHLVVADVATLKQGRVGLLAPSALARELEACGLTCCDWPDVDPPGRAPLRRRRRGSPLVRVLFSSSGPFAGVYGHTLSALAIAIDAVDVPSVSVDLLRPNEQSTNLLWDLHISDLVTIRDDVDPGGYDLVVEVTPDDALSRHALEAMRLGAAAVLGPAAAALAPRGTTVRIAERWEAADVIASDLRAALILAAEI